MKEPVLEVVIRLKIHAGDEDRFGPCDVSMETIRNKVTTLNPLVRHYNSPKEAYAMLSRYFMLVGTVENFVIG